MYIIIYKKFENQISLLEKGKKMSNEKKWEKLMIDVMNANIDTNEYNETIDTLADFEEILTKEEIKIFETKFEKQILEN